MRLQLRERRMIGLGAGFACVGLAIAATVYANPWWLSAIMTVSIAAWLAGVAWTIYCRPGERSMALGAVIASFLYVLLAVGPWFQTNVGPWLLTSRAFAYIETKWLGRELPPTMVYQTLAAPYPSSGTVGWNPGFNQPVVWNSYPSMGSATYLVSVPTTSGPSTLAAVGHWLSAWVCGGIGALAALWMSQRSARGAAGGRLPSRLSEGEKPFREVAP
jgi:hypothetical protein